MESVLREILKQNSKISRIIAKTAEQYPQTSTELDLALYASIKIDKLLHKHIDNSSTLLQNWPSYSLQSSDPIFDAALRNIEAFQQATNKLDSKINVLIHQSHSQARYLEKHVDKQAPEINCGKEGKKRGVNASPKRKRGSPQRKRRDEPSIEEQEVDEPSKSLSDIDHSILKLTNQIVTMMHQEERVRRHRRHSESGQESYSVADGTDQ